MGGYRWSGNTVFTDLTVDGDTVSAVITFVPSHTAEEELTCEASNDALTEPIRNTITIQLSTTSSSTTLVSTTAVTSSTSTESWIKLLKQQESGLKKVHGFVNLLSSCLSCPSRD